MLSPEQLLELERSAASARPEVKKAVEASVGLVKKLAERGEALEAENAVLREQAAAAQIVVEGVEPIFEQLAKRASDLEDELHETKVASVERRRVEKQAAEDVEIEAAVAKLAASIETTLVPVVDVLVQCSKRITDSEGRSPFHNWRQFSQWSVKNQHGVTVAVVERRSDAIAMVAKMLEIEKLGPPNDGDNLDQRRGSNHLGLTTPMRRCKKPARIL